MNRLFIWRVCPPDPTEGRVSSCLPTPVYGLPGEPWFDVRLRVQRLRGEIPAVLTFVFALPVSADALNVISDYVP